MDRNIKSQPSTYTTVGRTSNLSKNYYPEKYINQSIIQELFLKIIEGDISMIKNFILSNNITLNVKDEKGNSVLHQALRNTNLTKGEKLELVNFLLDHGAPIVSYNDENITPLHLAVKNQLYDIITIFLDKGADPNVVDNQFMTPLHYAVQGKSVECPANSVHKKIITDALTKPNILLDEMVKNIRKLMLEDDSINQYLVHISNTLGNYNEIFGKDIDSIKKKFYNDVEQIIAKKDADEREIEETIKKRADLLNNEIIKNMMTNMGNAMTPFEIKPKQKSGPHNVLPWTKVTEQIEKHKNEVYRLAKLAQQNITGELNLLENSVDTLYNMTESIHTSIKNLYWYNAGFYINTNNIENNIAPIIKKYVYVNPKNMCLNDIALDIYNEIPINNGDIERKIVDLSAYNNISWEMTEVNGNRIAVDLLKIDKRFDYGSSPKNIKRGKGNDIFSAKSDFADTAITDDRNIANPNTIINGTWGRKPVVNAGRRIIIEPTFNNIIRGYMDAVPAIPNEIPNNIGIPAPGGNINTDSTFGYIDYDYTIVSKIRYYILRIKKYIEGIKLNNRMMYNYIATGNIYYVPNSISLNITYIINSLLYIKLINDELLKAKENFLTLGSKLDSIYTKNENHSHAFYLDMARNTVKQIVYGINNDVNMSHIFSNFTIYSKNYDFIIKNANKLGLLGYMMGYNNKFEITNDAHFFWKKNTNNISSIFTDSLEYFSISNIRFEDFDNYLTSSNISSDSLSQVGRNNVANDSSIVRKRLIEKYIPQINTYSSIYYIARNTNIYTLPRIEYIYRPISSRRIPSLNINFASSQPVLDAGIDMVSLNLRFNAPERIAMQDIDEMEPGFIFETSNTIPSFPKNIIDQNMFAKIGLHEGDIPMTNTYEPGNMAIIGYISTPYIQSKKIAAIPIINVDIQLYLSTFRYMIIESVLENIYGMQNSNVTYNDVWTDIINLIPKYGAFIQKMIGNRQNEINGIIYSTIGKIIDNIVLNVISENIYEKSHNNVSNIVNDNGQQNNSRNISSIYEKLNNINQIEYIPNQNYYFEVDLNEIINDVIGKYINDDITLDDIDKSYQINFTAQPLDDDISSDSNINILYSYSSNSQKFAKQCYSIDEDIIQKLVHVTNINKKDVAGNIPLYYAIETQNISIVKLLLDSGSGTNIKSVGNNSGKTPWDHIREIYKTHIEILNKPGNSITNLTMPIYEKLKRQIKQNPLNKDNILRYSDIYMPMLLILFNHYLFSFMKNYPNGWTYDDITKLSYCLTGDQNIFLNPKLPLLMMNKEFIKNNGVNGIDILDDQEIMYQTDRDGYNYDNNVVLDTNNNLAKELTYLENKIDYTKIANGQTDDDINNDINRIIEIRNEMNKNTKKINKYNREISDIHNKMSNIASNKTIMNDSNVNNLSNDIFSKLEMGSVISIYDSIFWKIINSKSKKKYTIDINYRLYPELMKRYIYDGTGDNVLEIHPYIQKYMYNMISKNKLTNNDVKSMEIIKSLYENVFSRVAQDYMELTPEYNYSNYVLKNVIDLMEHCLKHTIFVSMYNSLVKIITKYVKVKYISDDNHDGKFLNTIVENILNSATKGYTLAEYIFGYMPLKLIKITLNIYDGDYDEDKMYTIDDLYNKMVDIITTNDVMAIQDNSKLSKNLKETIIPYFKEYNDLFIKESKNMMDGYIGYLASESNLLCILSSINKYNI